jgi:multiple sugar transport system ATP-binding protein
VPVDGETAARLSGHAGKKLLLGLRPEDITVQSGAPVAAVAEASEPMGPETHLFAAGAGHAFVARLPGGSRIAPQEKVSLAFNMRHAHFFDLETERAIG